MVTVSETGHVDLNSRSGFEIPFREDPDERYSKRVELLGRYSKQSRSLQKFHELLELVPAARTPAPRRARQTQRRLRERQINELVAAYLAGSTASELASQFGVHRNTVL